MRSGCDVERRAAKDFGARKATTHNGNDVDLADRRTETMSVPALLAAVDRVLPSRS